MSKRRGRRDFRRSGSSGRQSVEENGGECAFFDLAGLTKVRVDGQTRMRPLLVVSFERTFPRKATANRSSVANLRHGRQVNIKRLAMKIGNG